MNIIKMIRFGNVLFVSVLLLFLNLLGCNKSEDQQPKVITVLSFTADDSYHTDNSDDWVIVNDQNGNLIDYKAFESGDIVTVEGSADKIGDEIGITVIKDQHYNTNPPTDSYWVTTRLNYPVGKSALLTGPAAQVDAGSQTGNFSISVTDVPNVSNLRQAFASNKGGLDINGSDNDGIGTLNFDCTSRENLSRELVETEDENGNQKYKWFDDIESGSDYSVSYDQLSDFDENVEFDFPSSSTIFMLITAYESEPLQFGPGYTLYFGFPISGTSAHAGYLNEFSNYYTDLSLRYEEYTLTFVSYGHIPDGNAEWPERSNFDISDKSIKSFASTASEPFAMRVSEWFYTLPAQQGLIEWKIYSTSVNQIIQELPDEILSAYPVLALDNFQHSHTTYYTTYESADGFFESSPSRAVGISFSH